MESLKDKFERFEEELRLYHFIEGTLEIKLDGIDFHKAFMDINPVEVTYLYSGEIPKYEDIYSFKVGNSILIKKQ